MSEAYSATGQTAKSGPRENCCDISEIDTFSTIHQTITALFERIQPKKTWALIAKTLGLKEHTAKHRAANHTSYSVEEIQLLLYGDNGDEVLDLLMERADPAPRWWKEHRTTRTLTRARVAQAEWQQAILSLDNIPMDPPTRRKLKKVHDADRTLTAARAEKELAVGLLHQNQSRAVAGGVATAAEKAQAGRAIQAGRSAGARRG